MVRDDARDLSPRPARQDELHNLHFDDGMAEKVWLNDADGTIVIGDEVFDRCTCERCVCAKPDGRPLPLPEARVSA